MNTPGFIDRSAQLLRDLAGAFAARAACEGELRVRREAETNAAEGEYRRLFMQAEKARDTALMSAQSRHARAAKELAQRIDSELAEHARIAEAESDSLRRRLSDARSRYEREREDARWLADTVAEPLEAKAASEHQLLVRAVEQLRRRVEAARAGVEQLAGPNAAAEPDAAAPAEATLGAAEAATLAIEADAADLRSSLRPRAGEPILIFGVGALGAVGTFLGVSLAKVGGPPPALVAGSAGVVLCVALAGVAFGLRARGRARVGGFYAACRSAIALGDAAAARSAANLESHMGVIAARREADHARVKDALRDAAGAVERLQRVDLPRLQADQRRRRESLDATHAEQRGEQERAAGAEIGRIRGDFDAAVRDAEANRAARLARFEERERAEMAQAVSAWEQALSRYEASLSMLLSDIASVDRAWAPADDGDGPVTPAVRFGTIEVDLASMPGGLPEHPAFATPVTRRFELPAMWDLSGRGSMILSTGSDRTGEAREHTLRAVRSTLLRLLRVLPPGKCRLTLFDPVGLGQNFAGFMHLADHDPALVTDRIWTDARHFEQRLADLSEHIETVIQKYLRNQYASIQEYNAAAGEIAEPFRVLVIADYPTNITETAARRLEGILTSGPRCGVFTIVATPGGSMPTYLPSAEIARSNVALRLQAGALRWANEPFTHWPLRTEAPPSDAELTAEMDRLGAVARDASRVRVPFAAIAPEPGREWSASTADGIAVPIGRSGARKIQRLILGQGTAQHGLVAGRTGSGKSTLFHVLISNLAAWFAPDQIELYLVDFKKGVEFKPYASGKLPHARVIAIESDREFGLSVLRRLDAELARRADLFRAAGVQDVPGYRRAAGESSLPRVLLLVDEFQEFFTEDDRTAQESALLLDRLVRQGRAFGVHALLGSQTLGGAFGIARSTIGQMGVRIALQCSEADSLLILSEDNPAARLLSRPGEAIYNDASGLLEGNQPFQIVWLDDAGRDRVLGRVRDMAADRPPLPPAVVFEGNVPAELDASAPLAALLRGEVAPGPARVFLGDPVSIKEPTAVALAHESGRNIAIVGTNEPGAATLTLAAFVALAAHSAAGARFFLAEPGGEGDFWPLGAREIPGATVCRPREIAAAIAALADELERRESIPPEARGPVYLVLPAIHRLRDLRRADDFDFSPDAGAPAKSLSRLLREGPPLGVHTLLTSDTLTNLERTLDRAAFRDLGIRVAFQMSPADSTQWLDTPSASNLGRNRALVHVVESGLIERFRPFAPPPAGWIESALGRVASRLAGVRAG